jgi:predicted amidohydrolase
MRPTRISTLAFFLIGLVPWHVAVPAAADQPAVRASEAGARPQAVRVAGIVLKWIRGDKEANFRRAEPMIREAADGGARIVVTTECFLDGYAIADKSIPLDVYRALGEPIPTGPYYRRLAALAAELKIHLVAGMLEADGKRRYNTAVLIGPDGQLVGKYHKQKLGHESVRNTAGDASLVFQTPYGRVGLMICADRTEPDIVRRFCESGAEFLICPSGGMFGPKTNDPIVASRSRENRIYIVFVHPAEFLVTGPDGSIVERTILGSQLLIPPEEAGGPADPSRVFYFDLPLWCASASLLRSGSGFRDFGIGGYREKTSQL